MNSLSAFLSSVLENPHGHAAAAIVRESPHTVETAWTTGPATEPLFLAFSITKTIISVIVLRLHELGELALDEPVARWFPRVANVHAITVRQLLNHTAGIRDYGGLTRYHDSVRAHPLRAWTFDEFAEATMEQELLFSPGTGWMYSNPGYMMLKRMVELVAARPFHEMVEKYIAKPLHLTHTAVAQSTSDLTPLVPAMSSQLSIDGSLRDVRSNYDPGWVAHGVVVSTATDIGTFVHGLFNGRLLSDASLQEMTTLQAVPAGLNHDPHWVKPSYGLGLMSDPSSRWGTTYGHNGGGPGYSASVFHVPSLGATVCAMSASENVNAQDIVFRILDELQAR